MNHLICYVDSSAVDGRFIGWTNPHRRQIVGNGKSCLPIELFEGFLSKTDIDIFGNFFLYTANHETRKFIF